MTFSITARCPRSGQFGVAAATAMPAVGKLVTHASPRIGAVATQARLNPYLGIDGLALLGEGLSAAAVVQALRRRDPRIAARQFAVVDASGVTASYTGRECLDWAGAEEHEDFVVSGNRLAGGGVLRDAAAVMRASAQAALADRFIEALAAGSAAGGDRLGERSATIYIVDSEEYPLWDIRVDEHAAPLDELRRLHGVFKEKLLPQIRKMPTRDNPGGSAGEETA
jgi:uncharacterized Ntn-hydrolase superfamily protein